MSQVRIAEIIQIVFSHRCQPEIRFPAGERVPEPRGRPEGGRAGCNDPDIGVVISCNLEQLRRICQTVDFVQYDQLPSVSFQETFGIFHRPPNGGQFAVIIVRIGEAPEKR